MKFRNILIYALAAVLFFYCCGCLPLERSYEKRTAYTSSSDEYEILSAVNASELFEILRAAVDRYVQTADVFLMDYKGDAVSDIQSCIDRICNTYPLGRFAVEKIGHSIEFPGDVYTIHFTFTYKVSDSDILNILTLSSEDDISRLISVGLQSYINRFVFKTAYDLTDKSRLCKIVDNIIFEHPYFSVALKEYTVEGYANPEFDSVYCIQFNYAYAKNNLVELSGEIKALSDSFAEMYSNVSPYEKLYRIFDYLTENAAPFAEDAETPFDPSLLSGPYGPLLKGLGDNKGYALAFKILADSVGLDCVIISGRLSGTVHLWNLVNIEGAWYHSDAFVGEDHPNRLCFYDAVQKSYSWSSPKNISPYGRSLNADDIYSYMQTIK